MPYAFDASDFEVSNAQLGQLMKSSSPTEPDSLAAALDMLQYFDNSYKQAIQGLGMEQQGRRRRDEYRDGMLRLPMKSESPGP